MSFATFSGPLRVGTQRYNAGRNTGLVVLAQTATINMSGVALTTGAAAQPLCILPAGSKILSFRAEKTVAISGNSVSQVSLAIGDGTTADKYMTAANLALTAAPAVQATLDAAMLPATMDNIGTPDVTLYGTFAATTGNPTAGTVVVTVTYLQRAEDGSANPTPTQN